MVPTDGGIPVVGAEDTMPGVDECEDIFPAVVLSESTAVEVEVISESSVDMASVAADVALNVLLGR